MYTSTILSGALLAGTAVCMPFANLERRDNGTEYCSVNTGCVEIHRPYDCTANYTVNADDSCTSIGEAFGNFTLTQFYEWNPDVGQTCLGLQAYVPVCINTPWYKFTPPVQAAAGTVVAASAVPVPIMPEIVSTCTEFELVGSSQTVYSITQQNNITFDQFYAWNQDVNPSNPQIWAGYWVCVAATSTTSSSTTSTSTSTSSKTTSTVTTTTTTSSKTTTTTTTKSSTKSTTTTSTPKTTSTSTKATTTTSVKPTA